MQNRPIEPILRAHLIRVIEGLAALTGRTPSTIAVRVCGGAANLLENLKAPNKTFSAYTYDRTIATISDVWPDDKAPWPEGVPRFSRADLRVKTRRPPGGAAPKARRRSRRSPQPEVPPQAAG